MPRPRLPIGKRHPARQSSVGLELRSLCLAKLGVAEDLKTMNGMTADLIVALGEKGIKTLDDLADLAADEL